MARVLVIGGTLFIGRALVEQLVARGDHVTVMHRGRGHPFGDQVAELRCDRTDVAAVRAALDGAGFEVVYDNVYDWERGTTGQQVAAAALAASAGLRRYVFTSSVAAYPDGDPKGGYDEDAPLRRSDDRNVYGAQKADSEHALFALHRERGVPVTTLRPAFVYGPHDPFDRASFFWDRILRGRPVIVPEDGERTMQWVHVRDVARAAILATERDAAAGRAYNLGNWPPISQADFVRLLAGVAGRPVELVPVPRARLEQAGGSLVAPPLYFGAYLDLPPITVRPERARAELGLELTPLEEGMRDTFAWYERQRRPEPDVSWEDRVLSAAT